jgi:hypothetical protein
VAVQIGADPPELRRVEAGQLDERDAHLRLVVQQLDAQRVQEALERVLGAAVGRLQRDAARDSAEPTCTMTPLSRARMRRRAACVP